LHVGLDQTGEALALFGVLVSRIIVTKAGRIVAVNELDERVSEWFLLHEWKLP
jgi:hypothetical protein